MAFRYIDNNGTSFNLSNNTLRKDLMILEGEVENDINYPDIKSETDDTNLLSLYAKLNITIQIITESDLKQRLASENDIDTLLFIFSLNKTHFKALVYLIYEKNKSSDFFQKLIEANVKTRNRILLNEFVYDISVEEKNFFNPLTDKLSSFFDTTNGSSKIKSVIKDFSILDIEVDIYPEMYYLLWNEFFSLTFQNVIWDKNNNDEKKITNATKKTIYSSFFSLFGLIPENEAYDLYNLLFQKTKDFRSYLDALRDGFYRNEKYEIRNIKSIEAISYTMNTYFMEFVRLRFLNKSANNTTTGILKGIAQAISDQNKKKENFSFLYHLYFAYENIGNYLTTLNSFNFDTLGNAFNTAIGITTIPNFTYIDYDENNPEFTPLKNILLSLFTELITDQRSLTTYSADYFFNIIRDDRIVRGNRYNRSTDSYFKSKYDSILIPLFKNNFVILNDIVSTIGGAELQGYFERSIRDAIQKIKNDTNFQTSLDPLSYNTFAEAQTGLTAIKGYIIASVMSDVSETNAINLVYKFVLKNLIESYFDYLISTNILDSGDFRFKANENTIKAYKLLNFIKQIFIELDTFYNRFRSSLEYLNFNLFMLATKNLMTEDEIKRPLINLTFAKLENIFKQ